MKLIVLDRDGTINEDRDDFVKSADEWVAMPGALDALARLCQAGWRLVVATNQSGIGRGLYGVGELNAMHAKLGEQLAAHGGRIDAFFICPHAPTDGCDCRKPKPGLFEQIAKRYGVDMHTTHAVGDSLRDLAAAAAVGCQLHLVRTGKSAEAAPEGINALGSSVQQHADLAAFADFLLSKQ